MKQWSGEEVIAMDVEVGCATVEEKTHQHITNMEGHSEVVATKVSYANMVAGITDSKKEAKTWCEADDVEVLDEDCIIDETRSITTIRFSNRVAMPSGRPTTWPVMHVPKHRSPCPPGDLVGRHALPPAPRVIPLALGCPRIARSDSLDRMALDAQHVGTCMAHAISLIARREDMLARIASVGCPRSDGLRCPACWNVHGTSNLSHSSPGRHGDLDRGSSRKGSACGL
ncbi:hypothetical protein F3Y22_tig00110174pilonHSYRG00205 [Hibiscus syriacus]|uniref:Uncharacterized protein n=1 Tax=Hibiscus syriacus TaxID=106335 RepID=A0A6A3BH56_HIBSY|nr:hypothetical protein F3Y22_tig00110174pilonHSYRG00205 [Hibiscus syriacus]